MMEKGAGLHVAKVVEITSASPKSFEDAISAGIARASKTLEGFRAPGSRTRKWSSRTARSWSSAWT